MSRTSGATVAAGRSNSSRSARFKTSPAMATRDRFAVRGSIGALSRGISGFLQFAAGGRVDSVAGQDVGRAGAAGLAGLGTEMP